MSGMVDIVDENHHRFFALPLQHMADGMVEGNGVLVFGKDHHRFAVAHLKFIVALLEHHEGRGGFAAFFQRQPQLAAGGDGGGGVEDVEQVLVVGMYLAAVHREITGGKVDLVGIVLDLGVMIAAFGAGKTSDMVVVMPLVAHPSKAAGADLGIVGDVDTFLFGLAGFFQSVVDPLVLGRQIAADGVVGV